MTQVELVKAEVSLVTLLVGISMIFDFPYLLIGYGATGIFYTLLAMYRN